jgi:hypothetical protein
VKPPTLSRDAVRRTLRNGKVALAPARGEAGIGWCVRDLQGGRVAVYARLTPSNRAVECMTEVLNARGYGVSEWYTSPGWFYVRVAS